MPHIILLVNWPVSLHWQTQSWNLGVQSTMLKWCILGTKCKKIKASKKNLSTEGNLVYEEQEILYNRNSAYHTDSSNCVRW